MMTQKINPIAYLPIEYRSREFDGKLALAVNLIRQGFTVVIGQQWAMYNHFRSLPLGFVLFKSQNKIHHGAMAIARSAGHMVLSLEEESLALTSEETIARNCPPGTYELADYILTTGDVEKNAHVNAGCPASKLIVTGNPRVDVLKPPYRLLHQENIERLHERFGQFILINTNFGIKNSKWETVEAVRNIEIKAGSLDPNDPASIAKFDSMVEWEEQNSIGIADVVDKLSANFPDKTILVRPHPGESLPKVRQQYAAYNNVKVFHEGSHVPWTLAADLLIHTSCTTGMESAIAGKTAMSLVKLENWISRAFLSNLVNPVYALSDRLIDDATQFLHGKRDVPMPSRAAFEGFIKNIDTVSSIDLITKFVKTLPFVAGPLQFNAIPTPPRIQVLVEKCSISIDEITAITLKLCAIAGLPAETKPVIYAMGDSIFLMPALGAAVKG